MKKTVSILMLVFSILSFAQTPMTKAEIKDFVYQIIVENKKIKTLQSDFLQSKKMDFMDKPMESSGTLSMKMPDLLNWKFTKPFQMGVTFRDNKVYINNNGIKTSTNVKNEMFEKISQMISGSNNGQIFIDKDFSISYYKSSTENIAKFVPKDSKMKQYIREMELHFPKNKATVSEVVMHEKSGDVITIQFKNTKLNAEIPNSVFN